MAYTITLKPSGHTYTAAPGVTVLDAGLGAGFNMPYSCRAGNCKTCRGKVVEGRVDHGKAHAAYLPDSHRAAGLALLCSAKPLSNLVVEVEELVLQQTPPELIPCRVKRLHKPVLDIAIIELRLPMNENLMFAAGQYIDFLLPDGVTRSYSIANAPSPEGLIDLELHVRHCPGGVFTDRVFSTLKAGDILKMKAPLGTFYLREESSKPIIFLATGTGFAPVKSMISYVMRKGVTRPMSFYWGAAHKGDLYMHDLVEAWADQAGFRYVPVLSRPKAEDAWTGRTGYVQNAAMEDHPDMSGYQVYACGSPAMVAAAQADLVSRCGLAENEFFADSFVTEFERAAAACLQT